ncbi:MAG: dTDP-4-dehydrorhamnose 3,5-epimerase [Arenicella sp.]
MIISETSITDLFVVNSPRLADERGEFSRLFCVNALVEKNVNTSIVQINYSHTIKRGAIRGLHFQIPPAMETKMVRCIQGEVFDVAVDLRANSATFLQWHAEILSAEKNNMMVIPEGFAHGFQSLTEDAKMLYLHTACYAPEHEQGLRYDDPMLNINWPLDCSEISERDKVHSYLKSDFAGISQ